MCYRCALKAELLLSLFYSYVRIHKQIPSYLQYNAVNVVTLTLTLVKVRLPTHLFTFVLRVVEKKPSAVHSYMLQV